MSYKSATRRKSLKSEVRSQASRSAWRRRHLEAATAAATLPSSELQRIVQTYRLELPTRYGYASNPTPLERAAERELARRKGPAKLIEPSTPRTLATTGFSTRVSPSPPAEKKGDSWWGLAFVLFVVLGGGSIWSSASHSTSATNATPPASSYSQPLIIPATPDAPIVLPEPTPFTLPAFRPSAICNDGSYSFSQTRRGTCSHHGGVRVWG